ncbi:ABC transporter substrate-binding protein [Alicyclobacillus acidoterrestris]|uniref:ABC transporter substrate-binding protein n=1 Tax=Alicyclobacillus acidoterrestris (strain ATCC 49025 / DSM 3922 / CIP 106132 / NCIMB 13137 / GD3B) TaxID=1356854 RepID=T0C9J3_ALIAG|nr:ABC transporter substrate-binding protein [Alicyclobacillus acidoterrestris]EPZ52848.1 hypothetical protein N007_19260 [Alicyclobacillus acidoterrestris ATCC 49025]UNO47840.1 ABC transporter substrate-binding protein [Alicyclobacillus acidoterrestris]GEO27614.1 ABC transporter substrate-binding protein [Alicyclobacillus acidoterrestris]
MNGFKKKVASVAALGLATTLTLSGCGTSGNTSGANNSSESGQENITFSWWTSPQRTAETKKAIALFEKKYPNIHVTLEYTGWSGYWSKLATESAGGSEPDVMQMDASRLAEYITKGQLADLSSNQTIDTSAIPKNILQLGDMNGKLYAIPAGVNATTWIYNPAILKQAGIQFDPSKNYTWDDFAKMCEEIHQKLPNVYGVDDEIDQGAALAYYAQTRGEHMYTPDGKLAISKQTLTDWFTYWLDLQNKGGCPPAQVNASYDHSNTQESPFIKGETAFQYMFIGEELEYQQDLGKPIEHALFPDWADSGKPYTVHPAMYWAISSHTKYPDAAAKLVNFLENDPQVSKIFLNERGVTVNQDNLKADAKVGDSMLKEQDSVMSQVEKVASPSYLDPPAAGQIGDLLTQIAQQVTFKKLTPSQAADQFYTQATNMLAQG